MNISKSGEATLCDTIVVDTCHYTFVQIQRTTTVTVSPKTKSGVGVTPVC